MTTAAVASSAIRKPRICATRRQRVPTLRRSVCCEEVTPQAYRGEGAAAIGLRPADFRGAGHAGCLAAGLVGQPGFPFAKLAGQLGGNEVESGIQVGMRFLGVNVRARDGKVDLYGIAVIRAGGFVMDENDVRRDEIVRVFFEVEDLLGSMLVDRCGEAEVAGADVELHGLYGLIVARDVATRTVLAKVANGFPSAGYQRGDGVGDN
jgi:hypothetical protein